MPFLYKKALRPSVMFKLGGTGCSPQDVMRKFGSRINVHDQKEIAKYKRVYYYRPRDNPAGSYNYGWSDTRGRYLHNCGEHLAFRFRVEEEIGIGSFGQVLRCTDYKSGKEVAVKIMCHEDVLPVGAYKKELEMNKALTLSSGHKNILPFIDSFIFHNHGCLVFQLLPGDLTSRIKFLPNGFPLHKVRQYTSSILQGLLHLKTCGIVHGDLKPANILVADHEAGDVCLADFGTSVREADQRRTRFGTMHYMPPEMFLGGLVTCANDIWALGCIAVEMALGSRLFATQDVRRLKLFIEVLGEPPQIIIDESKGKIVKIEGSSFIVNGLDVTAVTSPLSVQLQRLGDDGFLDFVQQCLAWDPSQRPTPQEALDHKWMRGHVVTPPLPLAPLVATAPPRLGAACTNYIPGLPQQPLGLASDFWNLSQELSALVQALTYSALTPPITAQELPGLAQEPSAATQAAPAFTQDPSSPAQEPPAPAQQPSAPAQDLPGLAQEPSAATQAAPAFTQEPPAPTQDPSSPAQEPPAPAQQPSAPAQEPPPDVSKLSAPTQEEVEEKELEVEQMAVHVSDASTLRPRGRLSRVRRHLHTIMRFLAVHCCCSFSKQ